MQEMAIRAGRLRHRRLVNLIGYCCDGDERLLVAEFCCSGDSLARHLFDRMFCSPSYFLFLIWFCVDSLLFLNVI